MELKSEFKSGLGQGLPEGWGIKTIGQIAPLQRGFDLTNSQLRPGHYPVVYSNGVVNFHCKAMVQGPGVITGRSGTIGKMHFIETDYWPHNTSLWVTSFNGNAPKFIYYLYANIGFNRFSSGSGVPTLNRNDAHSFRVPLPSTKIEQEAIAEVLTDADALIESLENLISKKRNLKQGVMQELLTGKRRLPGFHGEWIEHSLRKFLLASPDYGINAPGVPARGELPAYLRITDIDDHGRYIAAGMAVDHPLSMSYLLGPNEIVFARTGASVGKSYLYDGKDGELVFAGFLIRAKIDPAKLCPSFLAAYTKTKSYWNWVRVMSMRSGQPGINGNEYASLKILMPPTVDEQIAISAIGNRIDDEITILETKLKKVQQIKQGMMQELLTGRIRLV